MKLLVILTLLFTVALAFELDQRQENRGGGGGNNKGRTRKRVSRPKQFKGEARTTAAARRPANAPARYRTDIDHPTRKRSKSALKRLPAELIDVDSASFRRSVDIEQREVWVEGMRIAAALKRQVTTNDFYECQSSNPAPKDADCQVIIDQVYDTNQTLVMSANSCVTFGYESCKGFFCSLCTTMSVTTDFVGNQLSSAESLCVANGQSGTVVGQDPPQWDAGFVYDTDSLPTYDVC